MGLLKKGDRADPKRIPREKFPLPECGEGVYVNVRAMTAREIKDWLADSNEAKPASDYVILAACLVDDDGNPIYKDELDEAGAVKVAADEVCRRELDVSAPNQIGLIQKILDMSGIGKKAAEERAKN